MEKTNKNWLIVISLIVAAFILWLMMKRNPALAQTIQNSLPFELPPVLMPSMEPLDINVSIEGYTPHDYPLPDLPDYADSYGNRGTSCNFCLQSRVQISPPSPPQKPAVAPAYYPQPVRSFSAGGGGGGSSRTPHVSATGISSWGW